MNQSVRFLTACLSMGLLGSATLFADSELLEKNSEIFNLNGLTTELPDISTFEIPSHLQNSELGILSQVSKTMNLQVRNHRARVFSLKITDKETPIRQALMSHLVRSPQGEYQANSLLENLDL